MTIDRCSICNEPAHASETDDFNRCAKCRRKGKKAKVATRTVHIEAATPSGYRWMRQNAAAAGAILLPDNRFQVIDEHKWRHALRAADAVEIE